ncbi:unnamed protein product, partial [marine sediment metagenome]
SWPVRLLLELTAGKWSRAELADNPVEARRLAEETYGWAKRALELNPNYRRAEFIKRTYLDEYDTDRATKERLALLEKDPSNRGNLRRLLGIYQRERKTEQARQLLINLRALSPRCLAGLSVRLSHSFDSWPGQMYSSA